MALLRTQRIALDPRASRDRLPIGPEEYFVLSRIEGRPRVSEVIDGSGLSAARVDAILTRLLELGAVVVVADGAAESTTAGRRLGSAQPDPRDDRRRQRLQDALVAAGSRRGPIAPAPVRAAAPSPTEPEVEPEPAVVEPEQRVIAAPLAAEDDPRLVSTLSVPIDEQRRLLGMADHIDELTPFEILGIHPTHDRTLIRRAFHRASRRLHPDAHHGRDVGAMASVLSQLFAAATEAHRALSDEAVRAPYVDAHDREVLAVREDERRRVERMEAARAAAQALRDKQHKDEVDARRQARTRDRALRQRERVVAHLHARVAEHVAEGERAEAAGNMAAAANHYRLALRIDPGDADVKAKWEAARTAARKERAKEAYGRACTYFDLGQIPEALSLFVEAADADPRPEYLARAADVMRGSDVGQARLLAMRALDALALAATAGQPKNPAAVAEQRLMIARAFLAAGQAETAREQALLAQRDRPADPAVRALLNSLKVT